jgi:hypothetical protein
MSSTRNRTDLPNSTSRKRLKKRSQTDLPNSTS